MMNALIIGLGNIGLRHLQGLSNLNNDEINVYLFDKSNIVLFLLDIYKCKKFFSVHKSSQLSY